jgi:uncharacterized protein
LGSTQGRRPDDGTAGAALRLDAYPRVHLGLPDGSELEVAIADTFVRRFNGLAWLAEPPAPALLIPRCTSVHTVGMRFAIDVVFITWPAPEPDRTVRVMETRHRVRPFRAAALPLRGRPVAGSRIATLELAAGRAGALGIAPGVELRV